MRSVSYINAVPRIVAAIVLLAISAFAFIDQKRKRRKKRKKK
ncbi:MAG: hypothetical protein ACHQNE_03905 [Candidatus Kapaibacterium sp.]